MAPWQKRLLDLRQLIRQAEDNYFDPNLFRLNVNNAIQTARTVTWLIQKNKESIPAFGQWYNTNVLERFRTDPVMQWLKDSRNKIEKEGDLEIYSECTLETVYSYTEAGPKISLKDEGLLFAGLKKLLRYAQHNLPTGVFRDAAISLERRWVASSLPAQELIDVLRYAYRNLRLVVESLDHQIGKPSLAPVEEIDPLRASRARRSYLKTNDGRLYSFVQPRVQNLTEADIAKLESKYSTESLMRAFRSTKNLSDSIQYFADYASQLYETDGYHITIGFFLGPDGAVRGMVAPQFVDHADKLIFWRELARDAEADDDFCGVIFISEVWVRALEGFPQKRISELTITGEALQILAADSAGACFLKSIPIVKESNNKIRVDRVNGVTTTEPPNFIVPLRHAWEMRSTRAKPMPG